MSVDGSSSAVVESPWSHLPRDILTLLVNRLDNGNCGDLSIHSVRLRSVCKSWRSSVPAQNNKIYPAIPLFPMALNPELSSGPPQSHFTLSQSPIFLLQPRHQPSASMGKYWVLRVEEEKSLESSYSGVKLRPLNPLTRTIYCDDDKQKRVVLPKGFPKSINLANFRVFEIGRAYNLDFVNHNSQNDKNNTDEDEDGDEYVRIDKVAVSTTPFTTEENNYFAIMAICGLKLWFFKLGDEKWVPVDDPKDSIFLDVVFHKGKFYALDYKGRVVYIESDLKAKEIVKGVNFLGDGSEYKNLVTSSGDLFMIDTFFQSDPFAAYSDLTVEDFLDDYFAQNIVPEGTVCLKIYKLFEEEGKWRRISHLDNHVFFLGYDCSYSVSASDFVGLKPNCVYYYVEDSYRVFDEVCKLGEFFIGIGVCDMDNDDCGPLSNFPDHWPLFLPPPTWFKPKKDPNSKKRAHQ